MKNKLLVFGLLGESLVGLLGLSSCGSPDDPVLVGSETSAEQAVVNPMRQASGLGPRIDIAHLEAPYSWSRLKATSAVSDGVYQYEVPIEVPPGRANLQPSLSLAYTSNRNENGLVGVGWTLAGGSVISRCPHEAARDGFSAGLDFNTSVDDLNLYCIDGQKMVPSQYFASQVYYQTMRADFSRIIGTFAGGGDPTKFTVHRADGLIYTYGETANAMGTGDNKMLFGAASSGTTPLAWYLSSIADRYGNKIKFTYRAVLDANAYRGIDTIEYGNHYIKMTYATRPDPISAFRSGFDVGISGRLERIDVRSGTPSGTSKSVWSYRLTYGQSQFTNRSQLQRVQRCVSDGACEQATDFTWNQAINPPTLASNWYRADVAYEEGGYPPYDTVLQRQPARLTVADIDGDGYDDVLFQRGRFEEHTFRGAPEGLLVESGSAPEPGTHFADFDGDGIPEWISPFFNEPWHAEAPPPTGGYRVFGWDWDGCRNGSGDANPADDACFVRQTTTQPRALGNIAESLSWGFDGYKLIDSRPIWVADYNGDSRPDILASKKGTDGIVRSQIWVNVGQPSLDGPVWFTDPMPGPQLPDVQDPYVLNPLVDIDGDRRTDIVATHAQSLFVDMNGDGLPDLVNFTPTQPTLGTPVCTRTVKFTVAINPGRGFTREGKIFPWTSATAPSGVSTYSHDEYIDPENRYFPGPRPSYDCGMGPKNYVSSVRVGDFNGDGLQDMALLEVQPIVSKRSPKGSHQSDTYQSPDAQNALINTPIVLMLSTGYSYKSVVLPMNGYRERQDCMTKDPANPNACFSQSWGSVAAADVDGDGVTDIVNTTFTDLGIPNSGKRRLEVIRRHHTTNSGSPQRDVIVSVNRDPDMAAAGAPYAERIKYDTLAHLGSDGRYKRDSLSCRQASSTSGCTSKGFVVTDYRPEGRQGEDQDITYEYEGARLQKIGRAFLGFDDVIGMDELWSVKTETSRSYLSCTYLGLSDPFGMNAYASFYLSTPKPWTNYVPWDAGANLDVVDICGIPYERVRRFKGDVFSPQHTGEYSALWMEDIKTWRTVSTIVPKASDGTRGLSGVYKTHVNKVEHSVRYRDDGSYNTIWDWMSGNGTPVWSRKMTVDATDDWGNPLQVTTSITDGTKSTAVMTFDNIVGEWFVRRPKTIKQTDTLGSSIVVTEQEWKYYDGAGGLKDDITEPNGNADARLVTHYEYDTDGTVLSITRSGEDWSSSDFLRNRTTDFEYDDNGYVSTVTNALGQVTTITNSADLGVPLSVVAPSGVGVDYVYDGFGTQIGVYPDGAPASYQLRSRPFGALDPNRVRRTYAYNQTRACTTGSNCCASPELHRNSRCFVDTSYSDSDILGRETASATRASDGSYEEVVTGYDARSQAVSSTRGTAAETLIDYDALGRVANVTFPNAKVQRWEYPAFDTTKVYDENNRVTYYYTDAHGMPSVTSEYFNSSIGAAQQHAVTSFVYDAHGNVTEKIRDDEAGQRHVTRMIYDQRDRKVDEVEVGATANTKLLYNAFGDVRRVQRADSTIVTVHDDLGRPVTRATAIDATSSFPAKSFVDTWEWDTAPNGIGRLARASSESDNVVDTWEYDTSGRMTKHTRAIDEHLATDDAAIARNTYVMTFDYDGIGRPANTYYPKAPIASPVQVVAKNVYDTYGFLKQVNDASNNMLWKRDSLSSLKAVERTGNNYVTTLSWSNDMYQLTDISLKAPNGAVAQAFHYDYDALGNLSRKSESVTGLVEEMSYDSGSRLESWKRSVGSSQKRTEYAYTPLGSMTSAKTYNALSGGSISAKDIYLLGQNVESGLTNPWAVSLVTDQLGQTGNRYDAIGRVVSQRRGTQNTFIRYGHTDLPLIVSRAGGITSTDRYQYDLSGKRAGTSTTRTNGPQSTLHMGSLFEDQRVSQVLPDRTYVHHVKVGSRTVADVTETFKTGQTTATTKATIYPHYDHLGSVTYVTKTGGTAVANYFEPFGAPVNLTGDKISPTSMPLRSGFTGHDHEAVADLIDMKGRFYNTSLRRFMTPDPLVSQPQKSGGYDPYAYVKQSPFRYTDPSGYQMCDELYRTCPKNAGIFIPIIGLNPFTRRQQEEDPRTPPPLSAAQRQALNENRLSLVRESVRYGDYLQSSASMRVSSSESSDGDLLETPPYDYANQSVINVFIGHGGIKADARGFLVYEGVVPPGTYVTLLTGPGTLVSQRQSWEYVYSIGNAALIDSFDVESLWRKDFDAIGGVTLLPGAPMPKIFVDPPNRSRDLMPNLERIPHGVRLVPLGEGGYVGPKLQANMGQVYVISCTRPYMFTGQDENMSVNSWETILSYDGPGF